MAACVAFSVHGGYVYASRQGGDIDGKGTNHVVEMVARDEARLHGSYTARIVLAAADGKQNEEIATDLGCTRRTVGVWRNRFVSSRLAGIEKDAPRGGRKPTRRAAVAAEIVRRTTQEKPANATHWSTRSLAKAMNISDSMVRRVWRDSGLKPHLVKTFKVSNDPRFVEKLVDVVGLYLNPPEHAAWCFRAMKRAKFRLWTARKRACRFIRAAWAR